MIIQFSGMSGAGKTTLAGRVQEVLARKLVAVEVLDGDEIRQTLSPDLGFSKEDRAINIIRMTFIASLLSRNGIVTIISAINPYSAVREEIQKVYPGTKTIHIHCPVHELVKRDTKGLYRRSQLPNEHPDKLNNLTGVSDPYEPPLNPDLFIDTSLLDISTCTFKIVDFIERHLEYSNNHKVLHMGSENPFAKTYRV